MNTQLSELKKKYEQNLFEYILWGYFNPETGKKTPTCMLPIYARASDRKA